MNGIVKDEREKLKADAARRAVEFVKPSMIVGLGTGSTVFYALQEIGKLISNGLEITGVATSIGTENLANELNIPLISFNEAETIDLVIDGADEIDPELNMIKGGGGALTREKLIALNAKQRIIIIDETKLVSRLGEKYRLPVEVLPFCWRPVSNQLVMLNCSPQLRRNSNSILETDNGNYILDCQFPGIDEAGELEREIKLISGIVESGLFIGLADIVVVAGATGVNLLYKKG
ncbi:MAG: ribose-5-phosphate isomerase RpiA [Acidobacteriota bacterium]